MDELKPALPEIAPGLPAPYGILVDLKHMLGMKEPQRQQGLIFTSQSDIPGAVYLRYIIKWHCTTLIPRTPAKRQ